MMSTLGNLIKIPNLGRHLAAVQLAISENHYTCGKVDAVAKINPLVTNTPDQMVMFRVHPLQKKFN